MDIYGKPESIECASAHVIAKKITAVSSLNHEVFGRCNRYVCKRDGKAEIQKELDPKQSHCNNPHSHKDLGDTLVAPEFEVLVKGVKAYRIAKTTFSGRHNTNEFTTKDYTYAEVVEAYPGAQNIQVKIPEKFVSPIKQLL